MDSVIEINDFNNVIVEPGDEQTAKNNLLKLLEKKKLSMRIVAACHYYLSSRYNVVAKIFSYTSVGLNGMAFILSTILGDNCTSQVNVPLAVVTSVSLIVTGINAKTDFSQLSKSHMACHKTAIALADEIEYVMLRNNHTKEGLQHTNEIYEDQIKSFRQTEEDIPIGIKQYYIPKILEKIHSKKLTL